MTIDAVRIVTVELVVARRHSSNFSEDSALVIADRIVVSMGAVHGCTFLGTLEVVDVAQLELLDTLDFVVQDCCVSTVNSLA